MPRIICFVCLLGCVGCVGTGKSGLQVAGTSDHELKPVIAAQDRHDPGNGSPAVARTASFRPGILPADSANQLASTTQGQIGDAGLLEAPLTDRSLTESSESAVETPSQQRDLAQLPSDAQLPSEPGVLPLNLPTVLSMVGGQHPAVGLAQWRVQQAYANLDQARVLWLPSIQAGFSFHRHDGNYQASDGRIVDVNRNSFQYGLGAGATGAGTTTRPGLVAQFHMADAIFQPKLARQVVSARSHAANAVINRQLMDAAIAYLELLDAHQEASIVAETRQRTSELYKLTSDFSAAGKGLQADADRMGTELALVENRMVSTRERIDVASANLAQTVSAPTTDRIVPMDLTIVPIDLVSMELDKSDLIRTGLSNRPELRESRALVAAACEQHRRQKYAPFVPSVLLGFSSGEFGGGLGNNLDNVDGRYDFDALVSWEVRHLGFGERAARRESNSRIQQAKFEKIRVMDQVARDVSEAHSQVWHRTQQITLTQRAIESAENSYQRNLSRIRDGQGLPLEVLLSLRALEDAQRAYLRAVVDSNKAQFRLQWSLGWPVTAP